MKRRFTVRQLVETSFDFRRLRVCVARNPNHLDVLFEGSVFFYPAYIGRKKVVCWRILFDNTTLEVIVRE